VLRLPKTWIELFNFYKAKNYKYRSALDKNYHKSYGVHRPKGKKRCGLGFVRVEVEVVIKAAFVGTDLREAFMLPPLGSPDVRSHTQSRKYNRFVFRHNLTRIMKLVKPMHKTIVVSLNDLRSYKKPLLSIAVLTGWSLTVLFLPHYLFPLAVALVLKLISRKASADRGAPPHLIVYQDQAIPASRNYAKKFQLVKKKLGFTQFVLGRLATLLERVVNGISYSEARISEWLWWLTALLSLTLSVLLLIIPFRILVCVAGLAIIATPPAVLPIRALEMYDDDGKEKKKKRKKNKKPGLLRSTLNTLTNVLGRVPDDYEMSHRYIANMGLRRAKTEEKNATAATAATHAHSE